jgi:hypothetical protein
MISGLSYSVLMLLFYLIRFRESIWLVYAALISAILSLISPGLFQYINRVVHPVGRFLIDIIIKAILIVFFYLIFTPIAVIRRSVNKEGLIKLEFEKGLDTYFIDREKVEYREDFFKRLY